MAYSKKNKELSPGAIWQQLSVLPFIASEARFLLALSGGADSSALLALLQPLVAQYEISLRVLHIDHGWHPDSADWAQFCRRQCESLGISIQVENLPLPLNCGESIEAWAREQRYALLAQKLQPKEVLLTAHHRNDQCETVLAHLLRGSGVRGLAGMKNWRKFAAGWHVRPLLPFGRAEIEGYLQTVGYSYIEDPGNTDLRFRRNVLRHKIIPLLQQYWPGAENTILRVATHQRALSDLVDELATDDLSHCSVENGRVVAIDKLSSFSRQRQINLLFLWLRKLSLPAPSTVIMQRILIDAVYSQYSRIPEVRWQGAVVRRHRQYLYAWSASVISCSDTSPLLWSVNEPLSLPFGTLRMQKKTAQGITSARCPANLKVAFRQGGERIRLAGHRHRHQVKKLFQSHNILPWQRTQVPLIYAGEELIAIPGIGIANDWQAGNEEEGNLPEWQPLLYPWIAPQDVTTSVGSTAAET